MFKKNIVLMINLGLFYINANDMETSACPISSHKGRMPVMYNIIERLEAAKTKQSSFSVMFRDGSGAACGGIGFCTLVPIKKSISPEIIVKSVSPKILTSVMQVAPSPITTPKIEPIESVNTVLTPSENTLRQRRPSESQASDSDSDSDASDLGDTEIEASWCCCPRRKSK